MTDSIALGQPTVGDEELAAVAEVFRSGWLAGQGPTGRVFEEEFAAALGVGHVVAVSNCTAALHLALLAHGVGPGDEVIVADHTFPATAHAVLFTGATPVFANVRAATGCVDPDAVAALVGPRNRIHPTAVLGDGVELGEHNVIGPYAVLVGPLRIGDHNWVGPHAVIGTPAEHRDGAHPIGWEGELGGTGVEIGHRNRIREFTSIHQGIQRSTRIGDEC